MELLDLTALMISLIAALSFVNARLLRLPATIGVTLGGLLVSLAVLVLARLDLTLAQDAVEVVRQIDFDTVVFDGVLSFLLFAGALGVDTHELWRMRTSVLAFALVATAISIGLVAVLLYGLVLAFGLQISFAYCLVFGALISPTDPVAVLAMLKHAKVPDRIETLVAGESLFNDGVGVVAFVVLLGVAQSGEGDAETGHGGAGVVDALALFGQEAIGGLVLGVVLGGLAFLALRSVDDFVTEILATLGLVLGLTAIAAHLHVSAPLAAVAGGLLVGLLTDRRPDLLTSHERFQSVWHLIDDLLNLALFALLALELLAIEFDERAVMVGALAIPLVLIARTVSVNLPYYLLHRQAAFPPYTRRLMIWGGLRGALAFAMAFTVPAGTERETFLVMTYLIVVFSVLVQGLTVGRLAARAGSAPGDLQASTK